jgi:hypothetical protein
MYTSAPCNVKPYCPEKFGVLSSGILARPVRPRLPPIGQHFMDHAYRLICRPPDEVERLIEAGDISPVYPYLDVRLRRSRSSRLQLLRRLMEVRLVGFSGFAFALGRRSSSSPRRTARSGLLLMDARPQVSTAGRLTSALALWQRWRPLTSPTTPLQRQVWPQAASPSAGHLLICGRASIR